MSLYEDRETDKHYMSPTPDTSLRRDHSKSTALSKKKNTKKQQHNTTTTNDNNKSQQQQQLQQRRRIAQRRRMILKGKNTVGYEEYRKQVPKHKRRPRTLQHPTTPDHTQTDIPNKRWLGLVKAWYVVLLLVVVLSCTNVLYSRLYLGEEPCINMIPRIS